MTNIPQIPQPGFGSLTEAQKQKYMQQQMVDAQANRTKEQMRTGQKTEITIGDINVEGQTPEEIAEAVKQEVKRKLEEKETINKIADKVLKSPI
jgi:hypothetical protein